MCQDCASVKAFLAWIWEDSKNAFNLGLIQCKKSQYINSSSITERATPQTVYLHKFPNILLGKGAINVEFIPWVQHNSFNLQYAKENRQNGNGFMQAPLIVTLEICF